MAMVLCIGWDQSLLDTRALILKSAGHEVRQARTQKEVVSLCEAHQFDVAVIGQPISSRMKQLAASIIRELCTHVKILELYQPHQGKALSDADAWLEVPADVPGDLAERVTELANRK
jgi:CheY-like chemotaxis protein